MVKINKGERFELVTACAEALLRFKDDRFMLPDDRLEKVSKILDEWTEHIDNQPSAEKELLDETKKLYQEIKGGEDE